MARAGEEAEAEAEAESFAEQCRRAGYDERELERAFRELSADPPPVAALGALRGRLKALAAIALLALLLRSGAPASEDVAWHASAAARILMVRLLPFYDWTGLFYETCLFRLPSFAAPETPETDVREPSDALSFADCSVCEAVDSIGRLSNARYDDVFYGHLLRGAPAIVTDADSDWASVRSPEINLTRALAEDERLRESVPCALLTNLRTGRQPSALDDLLDKIADARSPSWFVHFQNCDLKAVKSLRTLAPRPYFLSPHVPPAHFNWLLMSDKYPAPRFKPLELDPGLITLSQLKGATSVRLAARSPCEALCPIVSFDVRQGETLVLANSLWNFEYLPDENLHNVAVLTETAWNEA